MAIKHVAFSVALLGATILVPTCQPVNSIQTASGNEVQITDGSPMPLPKPIGSWTVDGSPMPLPKPVPTLVADGSPMPLPKPIGTVAA